MNNHENKIMSEIDFESMLKSSLSELPPEDIVREVTPWKKAMNRILIGMALSAVTFHFWYLDYLLPAIGMLLLLLGFRALRRENRWFRNCFIITIIRAGFLFLSLILNTTIVWSSVYTPPVGSMLTAVNLVLLFLNLIFLRCGVRTVQQKAGIPPHAGAATALILWYVVICLLASIQYSGLIISGIMIIGYIFIIYNLYKLSGELDEAGYSVQSAPVRVSDRTAVLLIFALLLVGFACGYFFGGSYPMEWTARNSAEHDDVEDIKAQLTTQGFPEYVLNDLSAEDIKACEGALQVVVEVTDEAMNRGRREVMEFGSGENYRIEYRTVYDVKELRLTGVGVQVPGGRERWIIFHHFLWTTNPGFYGTESIQLWTAYRNNPEAWWLDGEVSGRLLYDKGDKTFTGAYHSLGNQTFTSNSFFFENQVNTDVFAAFSMPREGERHRGYLTYSIDEMKEGYIIGSWMNYTHQQSWMQYPAVTAMENRMTGDFDESGAFKTVQSAIKADPTDEEVEILN